MLSIHFGLITRRTVDAQRFFFQIADLRLASGGSIAEVSLGLRAGQAADRRDHAAVELKVIVGVEDVVLAVVLVVQRDLNRLAAVRRRPACASTPSAFWP